MKVRSYNYYRVRSSVRLLFWSSISISLIWLLTTSFRNLGNYTCDTSQAITVFSGDTLWSIVERNCEGDIRQAVWDLSDLRESDILQVGEIIQLTSNN